MSPIVLLLCCLPAVLADKMWSEKAWKLDKSTGDIHLKLKKSTKQMHAQNAWMSADDLALSDHHDVKSWAMLEKNGEPVLVGSKKHMEGNALPSTDQALLIFRLSEVHDGTSWIKATKDIKPRGDKVTLKLSPVKPEEDATAISLLQLGEDKKKKSSLVTLAAGVWTVLAPFWAFWTVSFAWPGYAFLAGASSGKSDGKTGQSSPSIGMLPGSDGSGPHHSDHWKVGHAMERRLRSDGVDEDLNEAINSLRADLNELDQQLTHASKDLEKSLLPAAVLAWGVWTVGAFWAGAFWLPLFL